METGHCLITLSKPLGPISPWDFLLTHSLTVQLLQEVELGLWLS